MKMTMATLLKQASENPVTLLEQTDGDSSGPGGPGLHYLYRRDILTAVAEAARRIVESNTVDTLEENWGQFIEELAQITYEGCLTSLTYH